MCDCDICIYEHWLLLDRQQEPNFTVVLVAVSWRLFCLPQVEQFLLFLFTLIRVLIREAARANCQVFGFLPTGTRNRDHDTGSEHDTIDTVIKKERNMVILSSCSVNPMTYDFTFSFLFQHFPSLHLFCFFSNANW